MDNGSSHERKSRWFLWGKVLTWALFIPFIIGIFIPFGRGIGEQKAMGLGAIAGGLAESYGTLGIILAFVLPVVAIVLLIKSFSSGHRMRALLYIGWNVIVLMLLAGLFVSLRHIR